MSPLFTKRSNNKWYFCLLLFTMTIAFEVVAQKQNKNELEDRKKKLQQDIEYTNQLLNETKKNKKLSLNQLMTLNRKIIDRQELINTISSQIAELSREIGETSHKISDLQDDLQKLKNDYARMIYSAYRNRDEYGRLMFIFASDNFNQAYIRLRYLQQYSDFRHKQAEQIQLTEQELNKKLTELEAQKAEKRSLLGTQENEKSSLTKEKTEKEEALTDLQSREKKLKADLAKKKKDAEKLQQAILRIIKEEIEKANATAANKSKSPSTKLVLTPEAQQLSSSFSNNKGKLPWPVIQGLIIEHFGTHQHPTLSDITIKNDGIEIATSKGAIARSVFDGEVTGVVNIPSSGQVVIVRHGEYLSVYANLKDVYVKTGDKVKTKQTIGSILMDNEETQTDLHLEIWKGQTKLDPEEWLFKK